MIGRERERDRLKSRDQHHDDDFQQRCSKKTSTLTTFALEDGRPPTERERERERDERDERDDSSSMRQSVCSIYARVRDDVKKRIDV